MNETADTPSRLDYLALHEEIGALLRKQIFFIGGLEKSGTTWLQRLLDGHPEVSCTGEAHFAKLLFPAIKNTLEGHNALVLQRSLAARELGEAPPTFDETDLRYLLASAILRSLAKQARGRQVVAVGEKTPNNLQFFPALARLIPGAKCIQIVRDPRDAVVSAWFYFKRVFPPEAWKKDYSLSEYAVDYARDWARLTEWGRQFGAEWPDRYVELRYEDLSADTARSLAPILHFLGADDGANALRRAIEAASFERLSGGRIRGVEDRGSFFRKGVVGDWRFHLDSETNARVIEVAADPMRRCGYI